MNTIKRILKRPAGVKPVITSPEPNRSQRRKPSNPSLKFLRPWRSADPNAGIHQRPFRPIKKEENPERVYLMARRNYQINAYVGLTSKSLTRLTTVVDSGAGSNYIKKEVLPESLTKRIQPLNYRSDVRDANNKRVRIEGSIYLFVKVGSCTESVRFNVVDKLGTEIILGCEYLDKYVEAIRPRRGIIEMVDGTEANIIRRTLGRFANKHSINEEEEFKPPKHRSSKKVSLTKSVTL